MFNFWSYSYSKTIIYEWDPNSKFFLILKSGGRIFGKKIGVVNDMLKTYVGALRNNFEPKVKLFLPLLRFDNFRFLPLQISSVVLLGGFLVRSTVVKDVSSQSVKFLLKEETSYTVSSAVKKVSTLIVGLFSKITQARIKNTTNIRSFFSETH